MIAIALLLGCAPDPREVTADDPDVARMAESSDAFAVDLYASLAEDAGNLFFSPFSIAAALSMTMGGANGVTEDEMHSVLHVTDEAGYHQAFGSLLVDLSGNHHRPYELDVANRLWGQDGFPFDPVYLALLADDYQAPLEVADFTSDPDGVRQDINGWVADQTRDRIQDLLPAGSVDALTRLVLVNAIYFLADWKTAFDKADTADGAFTLADGSSTTVPLMYGEVEGDVARLDGLGVLRLPYEGDDLSFIVLLPDDADGLPALEASLSAGQVDSWLAEAEPVEKLPLPLPSFEMTQAFDLVQVLSDLGMPSAFSPDTADFTGITDPDGDPLYIGGVFHQAFVKVDESGTEAAAATAVVVDVGSAEEPVDPFVVDHPFVFLVRDELSGAILFMGRVADPS